jgi:hypothetical protein
MAKRNVLVFPCGSEIGLEIFRSVRFSTHFNLIGGSSTDDHGRFVYDHYIPNIPFVDDDRFASEIARIVRENDIDLIMPAHDSVVLALAKMSDQGTLECKLVTSPLETCEIARSKRATYRKLDGIIPVPAIFDDVSTAQYPAFLKPDVGQGSKGVYRAANAFEASFHLERDPSLLLLEYLPGREFTVDCFTNGARELVYSGGRSRARIVNGISVRSEPISDDRFPSLARKINETIAMRGAWFFQVKERADGELVLMEIAPRVAGTMSVSRALGANLPLLSLFDALDIAVTVSPNDYNVVTDRALRSRYSHTLSYERVYLDFDDTVVSDGWVNTAVMAFVFQCRNNRVPVSLITRHAADLDRSLQELCLERLFDEVIWLKNGESKVGQIVERNSIFIDDSFAERREVHEKCGIPVFDTHMIDVLLED